MKKRRKVKEEYDRVPKQAILKKRRKLQIVTLSEFACIMGREMDQRIVAAFREE